MGKEILGTTRVFGLMGYPVHHTLSPAIHNTISENAGIDMVYVPFEVEPSGLEAAVKGALALDIGGLNVTIPHKSEIIQYLDEVDEVALKIGAVNTLVRTADGKGFKGYNTDYYGIKKALEKAGVSLKGRSVIILGAGGVSRPTAFLCADEGAGEVFILNRTVSKAENIAEEVNDHAGRKLCTAMSVEAYKELLSDKKYVCFQMTSVGMVPDTESALIEDEEFYRHIEVGFDGVYRPMKTKFLRLCEAVGAKCIYGLDVLLYQGVHAFELWNGVKISDEVCSKTYGKLLESLLAGQNIVLTGFMGSGKTAVSNALSEQLGYGIIDSDAAIEGEQNKKISAIFAESGEGHFRDLETQYMRKLAESDTKSAVLSVGGGLPIREENRRLMKDFGKVIFLTATPETVYDRVKDDDSRPLLQTDNVLDRIKELQDARRDIYTDVADIVIETDDKTVDEIAWEIILALL